MALSPRPGFASGLSCFMNSVAAGGLAGSPIAAGICGLPRQPVLARAASWRLLWARIRPGRVTQRPVASGVLLAEQCVDDRRRYLADAGQLADDLAGVVVGTLVAELHDRRHSTR
jgi:hypothetical protein